MLGDNASAKLLTKVLTTSQLRARVARHAAFAVDAAGVGPTAVWWDAGEQAGAGEAGEEGAQPGNVPARRAEAAGGAEEGEQPPLPEAEPGTRSEFAVPAGPALAAAGPPAGGPGLTSRQQGLLAVQAMLNCSGSRPGAWQTTECFGRVERTRAWWGVCM